MKRRTMIVTSTGSLRLHVALLATLVTCAVGSHDALADGRSRTIVAYSNGTTPDYRWWNGAAWESVQESPDVGKEPEWIITADCPTRNETALLTLDRDKDTNFTVYDGSSWRAVTQLDDDLVGFTERGAFMAYEQLSGDLLIAYWDQSSADVGYRTWNGTTLSSESSLNLDGNKEVHFLRMWSKPDSDEIMLVALDKDKDIQACAWNGTAWGTATELETDAPDKLFEVFDFAYEGQSGTGLLAYSENNRTEPRYRTWNGTSWSAEANATALNKKHMQIQLAADPASDEMILAALEDDKDLTVIVWNGSSWGARTEIEDDVAQKDESKFDVAYEQGGTGKALVVYSENNITTPRYRTWNGSTWSGELSGPDLGQKIHGIQLATGAEPGEIFIACQDDGNDLHTLRWNGTSMTALDEFVDLNGDKLLFPFMLTVAPVANVLEVVVDPASLTTEEAARRDRFRYWGYHVNLIDESDSQTNFDTAIAANHVAYVPEEVGSANVGTKLTDAPIGVVVEEGHCFDAFKLTATDVADQTGTAIDVLSNTHYITKPFSTGSLTITSSSQDMNEVTQYVANGGQVLAEWSGGGASLVVLEAGARLVDSTRAAGRRVFPPVGNDTFAWSALNADGLTLMKRSLEWARGIMARWKLDETSGTTASDELGNFDATLTSMDPANDWVDGRDTGALDFDGVNDRATTTADFIPPVEGSIVFWMRVPGPPAQHGRILGFDGDWEVRHVTTGTTDGIPYGLAFDLGANCMPEFVTTTTLEKWNHWYHVVATYSQIAGTYAIYLDGTLHKSGSKTLVMPDPATFSMGVRTGAAEYYVGMLDDVRILNHVVEPDDVEGLRSSGIPRVYSWAEVKPN